MICNSQRNSYVTILKRWISKNKYSSASVNWSTRMSVKGWRYSAFITGLVGFIGLAMYPIAIAPMIDASEYKEIQKVNRRNINQEDIQPGNMKVWSDPFGRKKPDSE